MCLLGMREHKRTSLHEAEKARAIPYLSATFFVLQGTVHVRHDICFLQTAVAFGLFHSFHFHFTFFSLFFFCSVYVNYSPTSLVGSSTHLGIRMLMHKERNVTMFRGLESAHLLSGSCGTLTGWLCSI